MTETRDTRLKRLYMRSWRRGMKEMDLVLGQFADQELKKLSDEDLDQFETILDLPDQELYTWVTGAVSEPPQHADIMNKIRNSVISQKRI